MAGPTKKCTECGAQVGADRFRRHRQQVHGTQTRTPVEKRFEERRVKKTEERGQCAAKTGSRHQLLMLGVAIGVILAIVIAALAATSFLNSLGLKPGQQAKDFEVTDVDGKSFRLSDHRNQVVVLVFMRGTWCGTCMLSLPPLKEVHAKFAGAEVVMLTLDTDTSESDGQLKKYSQDYGAAWNFAVDRSGVSAEYGAATVESHFVIDRTGAIVYSSASRVSASAVSGQVEAALA